MEMTTKNLQSAAKAAPAPSLVPRVDIVEDKEGITLRADLPGVSKENVSIGVEGDTLTIEGTVALGESAELKSLYAEVRVAHYKREFALSRDLDTERIDAQVRNGVLTLRVPKREQAKPRRIEVKAS